MKQTQRAISMLLCLIMLLGMVPVTPAAAAGSVISINQGDSSLTMTADHPDYVRDLWSAADTADGMVFDYTLSMNKADIIKANNAIAEADGDDSRLLGTEYHNNGELELEVMVELRRSEGEEITSIRGSATYSLFEYDLENESNRYYNQWGCWDTDGQDFLKVTASGDSVTVALDATLQELEAYAGEPIGYIFVYAAVRGQAYYFRYGRYQDTRPSIVTDSAGFSIYDAHQRETEIDSERMIALDRILTVKDYAPSAGNMSEEEYAKYYEPVSRRYVWTYDISREGYIYNEETDETLYPGACFRDMEGDGMATEVYNGILYGGVRGTYDAGANAGISLRQMLPAEHLAFVETLKGVEPSGDGGEARINLNFTLYVTYPDGTQIELYGGVADETTMIAGVCLHSCTVCSMCTSAENLACNSRYGWRTNACTCEVPAPAITASSVSGAEVVADESFCYQDGVTARVETFDVELAVTTDYYKAVTKNLGSQNVLAVYDITLYNEYGDPIAINEWGGTDEYITVCIPVSPEIAAAAADGLLELYHVDKNGIAEKITVTADTVNNTITFTGTQFSPFVLTQKPASLYYGRSQLAKLANAEALLYAYDQLAAGVEASSDKVEIYNGATYLTQDECMLVIDTYTRDYAHHFWLGTSWQIGTLGGNIVSLHPSYLMSGAQLDSAKAAFDTAAAELLSGITPSMSDYEKELYLHDAIASRVSYVESANAHSAYGALVEGKAVCEGYSEAFQYLLHQAGIPSFIIVGTSKDQNHAWNAVKIGGKWYYVDLTWDDQGEELYHAYFNIPTTRLQEDHAISATAYGLPACTAEDAFYFTGKDTLLNTYDVASVAKLLKDNGGKVHVYIPGDVQTFLDWYGENIVAIMDENGLSGSISYGCNYLSHEVILTMSGLGGCTHNYDSVVTPPTCTAGGYTTHTCSLCGNSYTDSETSAQGHDHVAEVTPPTCTADGYTTYTCHCGDSYTGAPVPKLGHSMDAEWTVITEPTCTTDGVRRKDCARCDHYETELISASGHTPTAVPGKDPTCTATGLTEGSKCATCGTTLTVQTVLPKLDHTEEEIPAVAPGCTTEGLSAGKKCAVCGVTLQAQTPVPSTGHSWTDGVCGSCGAVCDHTYDENGICTNCGHGCTHDYKSTVTAPTCTEQGYTTYTCDICGNQYKGDYLPALDHSWNPATCTAPKTCTRCGTADGAPNGHNHSAVVTAPTCTADGYTTFTCNCGDSYTGDPVAKLGHALGDWETTKEATCTEDGEKHRDCARCDHFETDVVPRLGHAMGTWETTKAATCSADGEKRRDCNRCDHYETEVIKATGHVFGQWTVTKAPTCTADGTRRRDCDRCDHYETEVIKAAGHDHKAVVTKPTCTADGYTTHTCSRCGDSYKDEPTSKLGHNMGAWTVTTQPTASAKGKETRKCSRCDYTESRDVEYKGNVLKLEGKDLQNQTTVWINGLPVAVKGEGNNRYVELPDAKDCYMVTYTWHIGDSKDVHTQYPTGMKVYKISGGKATHIPELDNILRYSGASIRITGKKGIRMITSLDKNTKSALTGKGLAGYKLEEYGTVLAFASEIKADGDLVLGKSYSRSNYAYKKGKADPVFAYSGNLVQYTNVLVGFNLDQCKQDIAMRPYIILSDASGNKITLYGGTVYRSIGYIAYQNRTVFKPKTASYNYVWEIIHHVYGKQYDKDFKG